MIEIVKTKREKKSIQEHRSINLLLALKFLLKMSSILNELKQEIKETTKYFKFLIEAQKKKKRRPESTISSTRNRKPNTCTHFEERSRRKN